MNTRHAEVLAQQRGIPPMVDQLLDLYGQEEHDGHGTITLYLSKTSIRNMERDLGASYMTDGTLRARQYLIPVAT